MSGNEPLLGSTIRNVVKLLFINWFRIHPKYYYRLFMTFLISGSLFPARVIQSLKYDRKIKKTKITNDPIFIIGVWRTGTTFLHYLMTLDEQFGYQTNLLTYLPHAGLNPRKFVKKLAVFGLPETRPMDNVKLSVEKPGEEEFPIALESQLSFYHLWMFPRRVSYFSKYLTFNDCKESKTRRWKKRYCRLIKKITFANNGKQLLLKNPPNTARIKLIKELLPKAKFVYLYREPYTLFASTIHLYKKLLTNFSYQKWNEEKIRNDILRIFNTIQEEYESSKMALQENELIEIRYNDLINNPLKMLENIYNRLEIRGFEKISEKAQKYIDEQKIYETNKHELEKRIIEDVNNNWAEYRKKYGFKKLVAEENKNQIKK